MTERPTYYVLDGHTPVPVRSVLAWGVWFERTRTTDERRVARTALPGGVWVSTVFLGMDYNFGPDGPPLLFESMAFPSERMIRTATWTDAEAAHDALVHQERRRQRREHGTRVRTRG